MAGQFTARQFCHHTGAGSFVPECMKQINRALLHLKTHVACRVTEGAPLQSAWQRWIRYFSGFCSCLRDAAGLLDGEERTRLDEFLKEYQKPVKPTDDAARSAP